MLRGLAEERQVGFQELDLTIKGDTHGPLCSFQDIVRPHARLLAQFGELSESGLKDLFHAYRDIILAADPAEQRGQVLC